MDGPALTDRNISVASVASVVGGADSGSSTGHTTPTTPSTPPVTSSQSLEYRRRLADVSSRATATERLNILFQQDKTGSTKPVTAEELYAASTDRIDTKVAAGSVVVEAGDFAAVACWEPPAAAGPDLTDAQLADLARTRPIFAQFMRDMRDARRACLGPDQPYWLLSLMARDPARTMKGAVRAVIEPYIAQAKAQGLPLWLVAGNAHARDVYAYFGFRVVHVIWTRLPDAVDDDGGVPTWCMVCNWPAQESAR